ncbi:hypothetical protein L873DRAFT_1681217 [Choiromyces venosus 120613-1]|uniref:Multiple myeloma tumor-associated protein 2-like N-terminal domain-containing protein n=1 Tax=Choiromyces venosus 120613-1 TaxID=1336337 RepID=A0A3N4JTH3_9PEZI|nr:hypothetical protein L873DRAFT_1681217 [Choiromyces venosus 120613-1]
MDLLSGLRKGDSSRGGRAEFKWDDVKEDKDRENYLGHSLMAPVGRWQKNKDLTWYAKSGAGEMSAEEARKEEIRKIKEAEQDALSEALGFKVVKRHMDPVDQDEVKRAIKESGDDNEEGKGVGFGKRTGRDSPDGASGERDEGDGMKGEFKPVEKDRRRERSDRREGSRSRGRDDRDRHRHRDRDRRDRDRDRDRERVTAIDPESGLMELSYPPAQMRQSVAGIEDKIMRGIHSPGQIERIVLEENGTGPAKPPNGNAFKSVTVLRGGSELGTLFTLRANFFFAYLPPTEGETGPSSSSAATRKKAVPHTLKVMETERATRSTRKKSPLNEDEPFPDGGDYNGKKSQSSQKENPGLLSKGKKRASPVPETNPDDQDEGKMEADDVERPPANKRRRATRKR